MEQNASEQELPGHQGSYKCGYGELEDGKESKEEEMYLLGEDVFFLLLHSSPWNQVARRQVKRNYIFEF